MINESKIIELIKKAEEGPTLDYKEDLPLSTDGDKAQFVEDVISLANSGEPAHIIVGVEDGTGKTVGLKTSHNAEQLNQILKDKCDPSISIEYTEKNILGYQIGVIEIKGENSPYIVSVPDKYGGRLSANPNKSFYIHRGTVYIRNYNINQGAKRADLDTLYNRIKYVALQADLQLTHEVSVTPLDNLKQVNAKFFLVNTGEVLATDTYVWIQFNNIKEIVQCKGMWKDISNLNKNVPTIQLIHEAPVVRPVRMYCDSVVVKVDKDIQQIEARVIMGAINMRTKEGPYVIPLKETDKS